MTLKNATALTEYQHKMMVKIRSNPLYFKKILVLTKQLTINN